MTPLMIALEYLDIRPIAIRIKECIQILLENGANTKIRDEDGKTALHYAFHVHATA